MIEKAVLAGGCFWCVEAVYLRIPGVTGVVSGYCNGRTANPTYQDICTGKTGHAEACKISFDTSKTSFRSILDVFWEAHDPTTLNRQGNDVGTQYRSGIYTMNEEQMQEAKASRDAAQASIGRPIVTEIVPLTTFYPAEQYHQNYFALNQSAPYCQYVIKPKLEKLLKKE